jgi:hypothetical protein
MRQGLAEIQRAGARFCSCDIAAGNHASEELALKLGFRRLPFARVVFRGGHDSTSHVVHQRLAETFDIRLLAGAMDLAENVAGSLEGAAVIVDELLIQSPLQFWKVAERQLVRLWHESEDLGIGLIGPDNVVLLPNPRQFYL